MIDLHSHILPNIDDGARSIEDTLAIAENSVAAGVTHMMCTPHIHFGIFDNTADTISHSFALALAAIKNAQIPLKIAFASEVRICPEVITLIQQNKLPLLGTWKGKQVLLLELPHSHIPPGVENLIKWLLSNNIQPVIPHPERNREIIANYPKVKWLKQLGCIFQVTAGAFVNRFSGAVTDTVWRMQTDNLITYVASDTHNIKMRPNDMKAAYDAVANKVNKNVADGLFVKMPQYITAGVNWQ